MGAIYCVILAHMTKNDWKLTEVSNDDDRYGGADNNLTPHIEQGQRLSELRNLADISPEELAQKAGISIKELLAIEAGLLELRPITAHRFAIALGVEYKDLSIRGNSQ